MSEPKTCNACLEAHQNDGPVFKYHEDISGHTYKVVACSAALDMYEDALIQAEQEEKQN